MKLTRPLVFFDIESTGLDTYEDRIVQIAWIKMFPANEDGEIVVGKKCLMINPMKSISPEAASVHGITDDRIRQENPPSFDLVAPLVAETFSSCDLAGFGIRRFDVPMLLNELGRCNCSLQFPIVVIDSADIYHKREPRDLAAAVRFYTGGAWVGCLHDAAQDVEAAKVVFEQQMVMYSLPDTIEGIDAECRDPSMVDLAGKLTRRDGNVMVNFGKHKGTTLDKLPLDYLQWMKEKGVLGKDVEDLLHEALRKGYAKKHAKAKGGWGCRSR